ncbi:IMPACT family protein [Kocuria massiliensis]|uniref:IMPACT family protein n=1 Tax=Kocuria massiliensis TaxID=1926282 RepID=UPI0022B97B4A|nr:YigZ family protein [Kocuria massiliensis]
MTETADTRARAYTVLSSREPAEALVEIKRSEFIGHVLRVETEREARDYIELLRKRYHDARHVCSAFVVGADREIQRSSDDGEPAGTAGIPMLQALLSHRTGPPEAGQTDLSDICAVVVRYFGGIKLGAGGLVRAYTEATVEALGAARLVSRRRMRHGAIKVPHSEAGRLENELRQANISVLGTEYISRKAVLSIAVPDQEDRLSRAEAQVAATSSGSLDISWKETGWVDL